MKWQKEERKKEQTMVNKTLHRKLTNKQQELQINQRRTHVTEKQ